MHLRGFQNWAEHILHCRRPDPLSSVKSMSRILLDSFTRNDPDALECKNTNEKYYEELRVLESICGTKGQLLMFWGYINPFGRRLQLLFSFV